MFRKYFMHGFEWRFISPHAPYMGGLLGSCRGSFKYHFKRVTGAQKYTFEEFSTLLARIEGVRNSRPISALSEYPTDITTQTPGHFLRGSPLLSFREPPSEDLGLINRWEKLKSLQHIQSKTTRNSTIKDCANPSSTYASTSSKVQPPETQSHFCSNNDPILLRTAHGPIEIMGDLFTVRAVIDPGSHRTFLSEKIRFRLKIPSLRCRWHWRTEPKR